MDMSPNKDQEPPKQSLYAEHEKVYPQRIQGTFRTIKWAVLGAVLGLYYLVPWLRWDRGPDNPDQAILIDMAGRRAYFLDLEIWPQEIYYLTGVLILAAVGLFFVTSLYGRVWCGFTCPQTLWTDLYLLVERWVEGDRNKRMKLDRGGLTPEKIGKKSFKHLIWLVIALATGGAWVLYFVDAPTATVEFFTGQGSTALYGMVGLFTATTYLLAGFGREQICIYMCPWPRFQSAMLDEHTKVVTYEGWRGEPRGPRKRGDDRGDLGDCIDCGLCQRVCPTGVDIRKGTQLACIGCGLCIDACNSIMDKMGYERELITYDSVANMEARGRGEEPHTRFIRPRTIGYAVILVLNVALISWGLATRSPLEINIQRDRSPLFVTLSNGDIRNGYTLKILNKVREPHTFLVEPRNLPEGATMTVVGHYEEPVTQAELSVDPDSVGTFRVYLRVPRGALEERSTSMEFEITTLETGRTVEEGTVFYGPDR